MRHGNYNLLNRNLTVLVVICLILFSGCQEGDDLTDQSTTSSNPDITVFSIVSTDPMDQSTDVPFDVVITATFNEEIDPSTDSEKFFLIGDGSLVPGTVNFNGKTATFDPSGDLTDNTLYTAIITSTVKDLNGHSLQQGADWIFTSTLLKPIANAGSDLIISQGSSVTLDGSGSFDHYSYPLSYNWSMTSSPSGSSATLSDSAVVNPTFVADVTGDYEISLVVNTDRAVSDSDLVVFSAITPGLLPYTVDSMTGLVWQDNSYSDTLNWWDAMDYCGSLDLGGFTDWRLPDKDELDNLYDQMVASNVILSQYFSSRGYWSSTDAGEELAWFVMFINGGLEDANKNNSYYVRCVRGG